MEAPGPFHWGLIMVDEWWNAHRFEFMVLRPLGLLIVFVVAAWFIWRRRKK